MITCVEMNNCAYPLPDQTEDAPTKIVAAAILHKGRIWTGYRHAWLMFQIRIDLDSPLEYIYREEQGFLCDNYKFVDRTQAKAIARKSGQLPEEHFMQVLLSEYLW
jgi:hypothetical protein